MKISMDKDMFKTYCARLGLSNKHRGQTKPELLGLTDEEYIKVLYDYLDKTIEDRK